MYPRKHQTICPTVTMSTTTNIFKICKRMQAEGFGYGSMTKESCLKELGSGQHQLRSFNFKPKGVFFSEITKSYPDIDEEDEDEDEDEELLAVAWYNFIVFEGYHVSEYASTGLLFAKFDNTRLTSNSDPKFQVGGAFRLKTEQEYFSAHPHWNAVRAQYAGIHVDPRVDSASDIFRGWDVDTVCIWDATAVTEQRWFENAGTPWTYNVPSPQ